MKTKLKQMLLKVANNIYSMEDFYKRKVMANMYKLIDDLLEIGMVERPDNPYMFVADKLREASRMSKKDIERIFAAKLSFMQIREIQKGFCKLADDVQSKFENRYKNEEFVSLPQLVEKLKTILIEPIENEKINWDEMEDETGLNKVDEEAVANGGGFSAQLGTAPTPNIGIKMMGKPWTSGKRKKKLKEQDETNTIDDKLANWLHDNEFKIVNSDFGGFTYKKDIEDTKHYINYDKVIGNPLFTYTITNDNGDIIETAQTNIESDEKLDEVLKNIEKVIYNGSSLHLG